MGNTKLDPRSLNAEERALLDALAARYHERGGLASNAYDQTRGAWMDLVKARRAFFGEPASEKKVSADPMCSPKNHHWSWGFCTTCMAYGRPQEPASEPAKVEGVDSWHRASEIDAGFPVSARRQFVPGEGGKVECQNCGQQIAYSHLHRDSWMDRAGYVHSRYVCQRKPAQPEPAANSAQAINARAEAAFAEATRLKTVADGRKLVTAETHPKLFPWVKPHAQMRDEAVAEAINTEPVAAVYIDSPGGQRNRVLTDETDKPVAAEMPEAKRKHNPDLKLDFIAAGWAKTADGWIAPVDELPEAVRLAAYHLRTSASDYESRSRAGQIDILNECAKVQRDAADALESFWRTHSAQPAKVRMTKELRRALDAAEAQAGWHMDQGRPKTFDEIDAAIAAVRARAAEAGKVRLPKVRDMLNSALAQTTLQARQDEFLAALAELDAAEERK